MNSAAERRKSKERIKKKCQTSKMDITDMKNAFERFMSRPNMVEKRMSELGNILIATSRTEKQRK